MERQEGKYNIKAASKMLGIQPGTLRAWERRYQMIAPIRNDSGHRLYTEEHINILKWLIKKVNQGFTISQAVSLMEHRQPEIASASIMLKQTNQKTRLIDDLLESFVHFDEAKAHEIMNTLFSIFTIEKVFDDVFNPILVKLDSLYESGRITHAHEQFAISLLRSRIGMIITNFTNSAHLSTAVTVCSPGEWNELPLLMFSFCLRHRGIRVIHLGATLEEEEIENVVKTLKPEFFFMSCTVQENLNRALTFLMQLEFAEKDILIGLVGKTVNPMHSIEKEQFSTYLVGHSSKEWEKWLMERKRMK